MSKRPWMPLWIDDYLADTAHLTAMEHGAYLLLIIHYWKEGGLPTDEQQIRRIARVRADHWARVRSSIRDLFGDQWRHHRVDLELSKAIEISQRNSTKARFRHSRGKPAAQQGHTTLHTSHSIKNLDGALASPAKSELRAPMVFIKEGTPQWEAWSAHNLKTKGKTPPMKDFGWYFPTEWPQ